MDYLYTLIAGIVLGAGGMYLVWRNNPSILITNREKLDELLEKLRDKFNL